MTEHDRDLETPIIPGAPGIGMPAIAPDVIDGNRPGRPNDDAPIPETDRDLIDDDSGLIAPGSPEFDHSLREVTD